MRTLNLFRSPVSSLRPVFGSARGHREACPNDHTQVRAASFQIGGRGEMRRPAGISGTKRASWCLFRGAWAIDSAVHEYAHLSLRIGADPMRSHFTPNFS